MWRKINNLLNNYIETFFKKIRTNFIYIALYFVFALFCVTPSSANAQAYYQITADELTILETNLQTLSADNETLSNLTMEQQQALNELNNQLMIVKNELTNSKQALQQQKILLLETENSLLKANALLTEYAKEEKQKLREAKHNTWLAYLIATIATGIAVTK